ncbi:MAG TPA: ATP-dependent sacrificial sulfur transferase LarE [Firmicutes bacterium]|nr:ATP-dependent sacrificial sulfur transferase LarE [Bacillota bacterium]
MTLDAFFREHPRFALAFSGGTDSAYLLWAAVQAGCQVQPYFVKTPFQPAFELADARRLAGQVGLPLTVLPVAVLDLPQVVQNPPDRCYHCKTALFTALFRQAEQDGYSLLCDGTNASDRADDRPGMRALAQLGVRSPLRECGITKEQVRALSRQAGLFTADKPSYACLATRIPAGTAITREALEAVETGESRLAAMGFSDLRLRLDGPNARLQLPQSQMADAFARRDEILDNLKDLFPAVSLDLGGR